jgi:hypothetical protein
VSPHHPPSPLGQKIHFLAPYRCVKFKREKKMYFFFVEEIVFVRAAASCVKKVIPAWKKVISASKKVNLSKKKFSSHLSRKKNLLMSVKNKPPFPLK